MRKRNEVKRCDHNLLPEIADFDQKVSRLYQSPVTTFVRLIFFGEMLKKSNQSRRRALQPDRQQDSEYDDKVLRHHYGRKFKKTQTRINHGYTCPPSSG